jgi:CRP-like cAMP-binding protein
MTLRLQIYALALLAFVAGLLRWRSAYADAKLNEMSRKQAEVRLDAALRKMEIEYEIEALGDVGLGERAAKWLRPNADR